MEIALGILQGIGIFLVGPIIFGLLIGGIVVLWSFRKAKRVEVFDIACSLDIDCPPGYVCDNGVCVPLALAHR